VWRWRSMSPILMVKISDRRAPAAHYGDFVQLEIGVRLPRNGRSFSPVLHTMAWGDCRAMASLVEANKLDALRELGKARGLSGLLSRARPAPAGGCGRCSPRWKAIPATKPARRSRPRPPGSSW
jgi:hypothetical protein